MQERFNVGDFPKIGRTRTHILKPHGQPLTLSRLGASQIKRRGNDQAMRDARAYMKKFPATTGILLIDRGGIVFEGYQGMGSAAREYFSMSIAKSITSLAVGKALCTGEITSLKAVVGDIVPELRLNNFGRSTVRQLLMMSSGAYLTSRAGQPDFRDGVGKSRRTGKPYAGVSWPLRLGQITVSDFLWGGVWQTVLNRNIGQPGKTFMYKAGDTLALAETVARATGMNLAAWFERTVWERVRAEHSGHWEADRDGATLAYSGFQIRLKDWGRLAIWILQELKRPGCFGDYLRDATTTQIKNTRAGSGTGGSFSGYGYQWWTDNRLAPGFWGKGYAGQELAINPKTGKILIKFGYRSYGETGRDIYTLYRRWNSPVSE